MNNNKSILLSVVVAILIIGGAVYLSNNKDTPVPNTIITDGNSGTSANVILEKGVQIITIGARGGYSPRTSVAKAGLPTIIRFNTSNVFDCSRAVRIASLNISKMLPQTGTTDVDIGTPKLGIFRGSCSMGMYPFEVDFR